MVEQKLEGLGGWLILVGIGVVISPIATTASAAATFVPLFQGDSWEYLTSRESPAYHVFWAPLLIGEILVNIGMIISWTYAAYLFFKKKSRFPAWYVGLLFSDLLLLFSMHSR